VLESIAGHEHRPRPELLATAGRTAEVKALSWQAVPVFHGLGIHAELARSISGPSPLLRKLEALLPYASAEAGQPARPPDAPGLAALLRHARDLAGDLDHLMPQATLFATPEHAGDPPRCLPPTGRSIDRDPHRLPPAGRQRGPGMTR
jgi:hypothetical protein